ncbi:Uncharacterised protein [Candidatus Burarchaeum australiense]|nr:Uncharacterised protein [Candidatus Burarchaeum australiense]
MKLIAADYNDDCNCYYSCKDNLIKPCTNKKICQRKSVS